MKIAARCLELSIAVSIALVYIAARAFPAAAGESLAAESKEFDATGLKSVEVQNASGDVRVHAESGRAKVTATKRKFEKSCSMAIERAGAALVVKVQHDGFVHMESECQVDLDVATPAKVAVDVTLGTGRLNVAGTQGALSVKIGSGDVIAEGAFSSVSAKSGMGDVTIKGLSGGGEVLSGAGNMNLAFAKSELKGDLDLKSGRGDATLSFPKGARVHASLKAGMGSLTNDLGDQPDATFKVSMKSGSGDLKIRAF